MLVRSVAPSIAKRIGGVENLHSTMASSHRRLFKQSEERKTYLLASQTYFCDIENFRAGCNTLSMVHL